MCTVGSSEIGTAHQPVLADEEGGEPEMRAVGTAGAVDLEWIGTR